MAVNQADAAPADQKEKGQQHQSQGAGAPHLAQAGQEDKTQRKAQKDEEGRSSQDNRLARRDAFTFMSPFALLQRFFSEDAPGLLDVFAARTGAMSSRSVAPSSDVVSWTPKIDVVQRGNELVLRADLPGVNADDVVVEIGDDAVTVSGERRQERSEEHDNIYRFERAYGAFLRQIPLPEGAMADRAKATFKDGVLEIKVPAPPQQVSRGRRLEIARDDSKTSDAKQGA